MPVYEYKVIPAPSKGVKAPGVKGPEARFAHALEQGINTLAADGWEYHRSDILPSEERQGLRSTQTIYRSVLIFRRLMPGNDMPLAEMPDPAKPGSGKTEPPPLERPDTRGADTGHDAAERGSTGGQDQAEPPDEAAESDRTDRTGTRASDDGKGG